jgi:3',5'-cyclic AMP phosphodiesterase CpdA
MSAGTDSEICFAVIADSHFHLEEEDPQAHYPSDLQHNGRNRAVVEELNRAEPAFVIHLGDVPHPVPGTQAHAGALAVARETYAALKAPLTMVPGNHDVGDKPQGWASAPRASRSRHEPFIEHWGAPFGSFDQGSLHCVWIDSPILNTDLEMEREQRAWLEADLSRAKAKGQRIFAFIHYPPFLCTPDEPEHYDNLAEPARSWLLDLLVAHGVEALFCGHVHHFFWNSYRGMDIYIVPATSFVRPEYSELCTVAPAAENGRDDVGKLGFFFVHIDDQGHRIELVRTESLGEDAVVHALRRGHQPPPETALGLSLRHDWMRPRTLPAGNLDEFRRKLARNDLPLQAIWEAGCRHIRVPAGDLALPETLARLRDLCARGMRLSVYSAGRAALQDAARVRDCADLLEAWEIVSLHGSLPDHQALHGVREVGLPIMVSCLQQSELDGKSYFSHFPRHGFSSTGADFEALLDQPCVDGFTGVIPFDVHPWRALEFEELALRYDCPVSVHLELARDQEGRRQVDDLRTARQVAEAVLVARQAPHIRLFMEPLVDHDRGYFPRNGLIDRRGSPRSAHRVWVHLERLLMPGPISLLSESPRVFQTPAGRVFLDGREAAGQASAAAGPGIDLVTGTRCRPEECPGPILLRDREGR